jgi:hypothetical protein
LKEEDEEEKWTVVKKEKERGTMKGGVRRTKGVKKERNNVRWDGMRKVRKKPR